MHEMWKEKQEGEQFWVLCHGFTWMGKSFNRTIKTWDDGRNGGHDLQRPEGFHKLEEGQVPGGKVEKSRREDASHQEVGDSTAGLSEIRVQGGREMVGGSKGGVAEIRSAN